MIKVCTFLLSLSLLISTAQCTIWNTIDTIRNRSVSANIESKFSKFLTKSFEIAIYLRNGILWISSYECCYILLGEE